MPALATKPDKPRMSLALIEGHPLTNTQIKEMQRLENCESALKKIIDYGFLHNYSFVTTLMRVQQQWHPGMTKEERKLLEI
jgi:hypothetical protein